MSLERFDGTVAAESADVNTHVRAAGGKGSVVLPVHVESRGCREAKGGGGGGDGTTQPFSRCAQSSADSAAAAAAELRNLTV